MSGPPGAGAPAWTRTDPRMVLVSAARALGSIAVPLVVVVTGAARRDEGPWSTRLAVAGAVLAVVLGVASWWATRYRFDGVHLQVRTGLLSRRVRSVAVDRVRSVELEASALHRVLGLAKVTLGTGVDAERITLDALDRDRSALLRSDLLRRAAPPAAHVASAGMAPDVVARTGGDDAEAGPATAVRPDPPPAGQVLARFEPSWVRFAIGGPGGLVTLLALATSGWFLLRDVLGGSAVARDTLALATALPPAALAAGGIAVALALATVLSVAGYVRTWWGMRLVREPGGTLHLSRGLTTTTSSTLEESRIRGVEVSERLALRALGGARLRVLTTGVGTGGTSDVLPACPRSVAVRVGGQVLGVDGGADVDPLTVATRRHGPRARRRAHVSAQADLLVLLAITAGVLAWRDASWWLLALALPGALLQARLAEVSYRTLGHALTDRHLVVTDGTLRRRRRVLDRRGVVGWTLAQSVLQRRAGLATLTAATAAGPGSVVVHDVPLARAVALMAEIAPGTVGPFLAAPAGPRTAAPASTTAA